MIGSGALDSLDPVADGVERGVQERLDYSAQEGPGLFRLSKTYLPRRGKNEPWILATELVYNDQGHLESIVDHSSPADLLLTDFTYDSQGLPIEVEAQNGLVTRLTYDSFGTIDTVTADPSGPEPMVTDLDFDNAGRQQRHQSPTGVVSEIDFLDYGRHHRVTVSEATTGRSRSTELFFDAAGQLIRRMGPETTEEVRYKLLGFPRRMTLEANDDSVPPVTTCHWVGPMGRVLETIAADGLHVHNFYDPLGHLVSARSSETTHPELDGGWDEDCPLPPSLHDPDLESAVPLNFELGRLDYDQDHRRISTTDSLGLTTEIQYDGFGRPAILTDPLGNETRLGYDRHMRPGWVARYCSINAPSPPYARPASSAAPDLMTMEETLYDLPGRTVAKKLWLFRPAEGGASIGDGFRITRSIRQPDQVAVIDDEGHPTVRRFDLFGRLVRTDFPTGDFIEHQHSQFGLRVDTTRTAPTPSGVLRNRIELGPFGLPTAFSAEVGGAFVSTGSRTYDELGRLESANGAVWKP